MAPIRIRLNLTPKLVTKNPVSGSSSSPNSAKKPVIILRVNKTKATPHTKPAPQQFLKLKLKSISKHQSAAPRRAQSVSSDASDISAVSGVDWDVYHDWMARNPVEIAVNMEETLANSALPFLMPSVEEPIDQLLPYIPGITPRKLIILPPEKSKEHETKAFDETSSLLADVTTVDQSRKKGKKRARVEEEGKEKSEEQFVGENGRAKRCKTGGKMPRRV